jgi:hypothetical protein
MGLLISEIKSDMKKTLITILLTIASIIGLCQSNQCVPKVGDLFDELKQLNSSKQRVTVYRDFLDFDFISFKPSHKRLDSTSVRVGYDEKENIKEIMINHVNKLYSYSLEVYEFKDHRIFLVKRPYGNSQFRYSPTAIYYSKNKEEHYMVNVKDQFQDGYDGHQLFENFPVGNLNDISCLMRLGNDLYPQDMIKISDGKIIFYSIIKYQFEISHSLDFEMMHFFIDGDCFKVLKIEQGSCIEDVFQKVSNADSNLIVFAKPSVFTYTTAPLWIFNGAHRYHFPHKSK